MKALTELSVDIMRQITPSDKKSALLKGLRKINNGLPASVYIPFVNMRNFCVLNIEVSETKLFITNHRAPYMVAFEVWRPAEEVSIQVQT